MRDMKIRKAGYIWMTAILIVLSVATLSLAQPAAKTDAETKQERIARIKEEMNNTAWTLELRRTDEGGKQATEQDTIRFVEHKIVSEKMQALGFDPTNFSIRFKGASEEVTIWETMQTSDKEGKAFWRGELRGTALTGALSWQMSETKRQDYSFTGTPKELVPVVKEQEESPEALTEESEKVEAVAAPEIVKDVKVLPTSDNVQEPKKSTAIKVETKEKETRGRLRRR